MCHQKHLKQEMMNTDQNRKEKITKVYAGGITVMLFAAAVALIMYHDNVNGFKKING